MTVRLLYRCLLCGFEEEEEVNGDSLGGHVYQSAGSYHLRKNHTCPDGRTGILLLSGEGSPSPDKTIEVQKRKVKVRRVDTSKNSEDLIKEIDRLTHWHKEASEILNDIDLQKIGKVLDIRSGMGVSSFVCNAICRMTNLLDRLDDLLLYSGPLVSQEESLELISAVAKVADEYELFREDLRKGIITVEVDADGNPVEEPVSSPVERHSGSTGNVNDDSPFGEEEEVPF